MTWTSSYLRHFDFGLVVFSPSLFTQEQDLKKLFLSARGGDDSSVHLECGDQHHQEDPQTKPRYLGCYKGGLIQSPSATGDDDGNGDEGDQRPAFDMIYH
jgi:hypothetical protein